MGFVSGGVFQHLPHGHVIAKRYRIVRPLGSGGMASVYLAEDIVLGESTVAIKILRRDRSVREDVIQRFLREVRLTHKINHENVVRTFDFGQDGDTLFYTMEYLAGSTLEAMLPESHLPIPRILTIAKQLMRGLAAIHSIGIIHRDLKPANIIMQDGGKLKIADFGIARGGKSVLTVDSGEIVGTITYLAPETLVGDEATIAVDYYALGAILYQLLTQHVPIDDDVPARLLIRKVEEAPRDPREYREDIPEWLARGILGLLEVEPQIRMKALNSFAMNVDSYAPKSPSDSLVSNLVPETVSIDEVLVDKPIRERILAKRRRGSILAKAMLALLAALIVMPVCLTNLSTRVEMGYLDTLFTLRGQRSPRPELVVVSIDEQSYSNLGVSLTGQWPRELHTKLLSKLKTFAPKRVVFDVLFVGESADPQVDAGLAAAMGQVPTVLGAATSSSQQATVNGSYFLEQLIRPSQLFVDNSQALGNVALTSESGRVRGFPVIRSEMFPDLASLAEAASGPLEKHRHPAPRDLINYYGPARTIPTVPYYMVLDDASQLPEHVFKDKIIFIGLNLRSRTGPSQREAFSTPFDESTFGTEVHATQTSNLLAGDWLRRFDVSDEVAVSSAITMTLVVLALSVSGALLLVYLTGVVLLIGLGQYLLFLLGIVVPVVTPICVGVFCGLLFRALLGSHAGYARWRGTFSQ
jgi:CHASE2 domain-containing sensor protein